MSVQKLHPLWNLSKVWYPTMLGSIRYELALSIYSINDSNTTYLHIIMQNGFESD